MKRILFAILTISLLVQYPAMVSADYQKTKIAVLDFHLQGKGYESDDMGEIVAEWFITALVKGGRFDVVERKLLSKILTEHQLIMTGITNENEAVHVGKVLGVKVIITGSVLQLKNFTEINARIIDVETATIIAAESVKSDTVENLEVLIGKLSEKIIMDFPIEGYVVQREKDRAIIDLGKRSGVKKGMHFIVYREGEVIKHPKTGQTLDIKRIDTGTIEITKVKEKISEVKIVRESAPGSIKYGQLIKFESASDSKSVDKGNRIIGEWYSFEKRPQKSRILSKSSNSAVWEYSVPRVREDSYAGVALEVKSLSIENRKLNIEINSKNGHPVECYIYSFVPGFSKESDDETFVPGYVSFPLKPGKQLLEIQPSFLSIPDWWYEENDIESISFNQKDIREIDIEAIVEEELGPISDTIVINGVYLQTK